MKKNNLYFIFNGGSGNRGCEAIVRGSNDILEKFGKITVFSSHIQEDRQVGLDKKVNLLELEKEHGKVSSFIRYVICGISYKLGNGYWQVRTIYEALWNRVKQNDIYFIIGGDIYCYGVPYIYYHINRILHKSKHILWGCSIEPSSIDDKMKKDLMGYDMIYARESITYDALIENGIARCTRLYPDPAFCMKEIKMPLPEGFIEGNTIGINISPMIMNHAENKEIVFLNYCVLLEWIIRNTTCQIALIPHVIWENNDDRKPLDDLYNKYGNTGRLVRIPAESAEKMKGYIARCKFVVAARTHASIAAYSSCVPTLVVGYSVKARGIAKDLFGTYKGYVVSAQELKQSDDLKDIFIKLWDREREIRNQLENFIPDYISRIEELKKELENIL